MSFLRPVDYYRGNSEALLAERRRKLQAARELRKQANIKLGEGLVPFAEDQTVCCSERAIVSLWLTRIKPARKPLRRLPKLDELG